MSTRANSPESDQAETAKRHGYPHKTRKPCHSQASPCDQDTYSYQDAL
uniref:Uncharacterized protein n=1 Tax=Ralstonia syzygii R24 TaxID=907261 RepID=G3A8B8_9RALS|nr:hypothetical protein RALSY_mp10003 [Ralstonia syzygii R24]